MKRTAAPELTPPSTEGGLNTPMDVGHADARRTFMSAALSMSWQLAIVVLVPIVGGFNIDKHFHMLPVWTIVGFVVAMLGVYMVLKRMLEEVNQLPTSKEKK